MKTLFNIIKWIVGIVLFIVFFGFAIKNMQDVVLRFFGDYEVHSPFALLLLGVFIGGAVFGVLGMSYVVFDRVREIANLKKRIDEMQKIADAQRLTSIQPPRPDIIVNK